MPEYLVVWFISPIFVLVLTLKPITMAAKVKTPARSLSVIASEIRKDWTNPYFGAKPYLSAMQGLNNISDSYGMDSAKMIVLYFLSNASTWRGEKAREIKKELNSMCK